MNKVFCFGEMMLRFSPDEGGNWLQENKVDVFPGGAELNVASALALWGLPVQYFTAMPDNYISQQILGTLSEKNIDVGKVELSDGRVGAYYLPAGADLKNTGVIYDRSDSSFSKLKKNAIDWEEKLSGCSWFHFSAITPALNEELSEVCAEALQVAERMGLFISLDLNYRSKLWQYGKMPTEVMPALAERCNLLMGNVWAAEKMLAIKVTRPDTESKEQHIQNALATSEKICNRFPKCQAVANTFRFDADPIIYYATLYEGGNLVVSHQLSGSGVVDKVGSGDCFMAGLIYSKLNGASLQEQVNFASSAAFSKLFIKGDSTTAMPSEIEKIKHVYA